MGVTDDQPGVPWCSQKYHIYRLATILSSASVISKSSLDGVVSSHGYSVSRVVPLKGM